MWLNIFWILGVYLEMINEHMEGHKDLLYAYNFHYFQTCTEVIDVAELSTIADGATAANNGGITAIGYTPWNATSAPEVTDVTAFNNILGTV